MGSNLCRKRIEGEGDTVQKAIESFKTKLTVANFCCKNTKKGYSYYIICLDGRHIDVKFKVRNDKIVAYV